MSQTSKSIKKGYMQKYVFLINRQTLAQCSTLVLTTYTQMFYILTFHNPLLEFAVCYLSLSTKLSSCLLEKGGPIDILILVT